MTDQSHPETPLLPDLRIKAPRLQSQRAALMLLGGNRGTEQNLALRPQLLTALLTFVGAAAAGASAGPALAAGMSAALAGAILAGSALRLGTLLRKSTQWYRLAMPISGAAVGVGTLWSLDIAPTWAFMVALAAVACAVLSWRARRDILTEHVLDQEISSTRARLDRESTLFSAQLDAIRAEMEADISALYQAAGLEPEITDIEPRT